MFESLGLENWTPLSASLVAGVVLGLVFGILAQRSKFCLRRGLVGESGERASALGLWLTALAVAVLGTQALVFFEFLDFSEHRFMASNVAVPAILLGGLLFGSGMVLARGCASRLSVLAGSGNLRALVAILVFAVVAHATLKGVLAPARVWLSGATVDVSGFASLSDVVGTGVGTAVLLTVLAVLIARAGVSWSALIYGTLIGALVPLGWFMTGFVLFDEFDPITFESLAFTSSSSESLFWLVAGTAIEPGFGVGLLGGVILGSAVASLLTREFKWQGFTKEVPTSRYLTGASLMGVGGVLAGGCSVGAGLTGVSTLSFAAMLALIAIVIGAVSTNVLIAGSLRSNGLAAAK